MDFGLNLNALLDASRGVVSELARGTEPVSILASALSALAELSGAERVSLFTEEEIRCHPRTEPAGADEVSGIVRECLARRELIECANPHWVFAPLHVDDKALGVLVFESPRLSLPELRTCFESFSSLLVLVLEAEGRRRRTRESSVVLHMAEVLSLSLEPRELLARALERLCGLLECELGLAYLPEAGGYRALGEHGLSIEEKERSAWVPATDPVLARLANGDGVEPISGDESGWLSSLGVVRAAILPLRHLQGGAEGAPGALLLGRRVERPLEPEAMRALSLIGPQLAVVLRNASLLEEKRLRLEESQIVLAAGGSLIGSASMREALDLAAARIASLMAMSFCLILYVDEDAGMLVGGGVYPEAALNPESQRHPLEDEGLLASVVRRRETCHAEDFELGGVALAFAKAIPLESGGQVVAVLLIGDEDPRRRLGEGALRRLNELGALMANAIERTRLLSTFEKSLEHLAQVQRELVQRERLAALGEMAALVAHEIRNPIGAIFGALGAFEKMLPLDADARLAFDILREESNRLNAVVRGILDYTRPLTPSRCPTSVTGAVRAAMRSALASEKERGTPVDEIHFELEPSVGAVPELTIDPQLIHQALVNVLSNALQAAGRGGQVRVRVRLCDEKPSPFVRISVLDDGRGVAPEVKNRLFEPFATTKASGSGLGLAVVRRVLEAHSGQVTFAEAPAGGAVFHLDLPVYPQMSALLDAGRSSVSRRKN